MPSRRRARIAAGLLLVTLVAAGCTDDDSPSADPSSDPTTAETETQPADSGVPAELRPYYRQQVDWSSCSQGDCATVKVPVDYAEPGGETTELALARRPADDPDKRLGTLFINPGGPGGSGIDYLQTFTDQASDDVLARYDIIGFDPRGVGTSDPVECVDDEELDKIVAADPDPDTSAETKAYVDSVVSMGKGCLAGSGALAENMSTIDVAKDLDVLRGLVGDELLTYAGASYGTFIGSTYAELFPKKVGRMVLDGAIDPSLSLREATMAQAGGFEGALRAYAEDCVSGGESCPLGDDVDAGMQKIGDFLEKLDDSPVETGDTNRPLTRSLAFYGIALPLYDEQAWPALSQALGNAFGGDGALLLQYSDLYFDRTSGGYESNQFEAQSAVNCLDTSEDVSPADIRKAVPAYEKAAPVFGEIFAWSELTCGQWPIESAHKPLDIDGSGAAPILVVGTTRDPATPYEQAVSLAKELDSGVLLSRDGDGHTAYHRGNACIDETIDAYLLDGDVPDDGKEC
ncbi:alpha/beta hydrolase [Solicola gregarius]|uniref:Alpha/beta hydrolase n=1 Tax=Solicola gregarius TaxID=2908642 RepID=A0AA46TDR0_9ACTN|nr:alpha/beta hydrolase [Solicola gregarius]UYM03391.1 alpha/beta hydrolase [Solicola gregarius]